MGKRHAQRASSHILPDELNDPNDPSRLETTKQVLEPFDGGLFNNKNHERILNHKNKVVT